MEWRLPLICFIVWLRAIPARELPILHRDADDQYIDGDRIVQSGSTFSLNCSSDQPVEWHLPVYAKALSRHGERLGRRRKTLTDNNTSVLTVTDSFYMDTGSYTCRQVATNQSVTQYVYVADDNNLVTLDEEEPSFVAIAGQSISVPCKPTHPSVKVHMKYENGTIIKSGWTFDPHLGFSNTPVRPNAEHILECCGNLGDEKRPEHCAAITFGVKRDTLRAPKPFIEPSAATVHVTVAESVAINCSAWSEMGGQFQISWVLPDGQSKDIKVLKQSRGVKRSDGESEFMESYRLLTVSGVRLEHSGTYQCVTRDYTGKTDSASFRLQVHEVGESFLKVAAEERQHIQLFPGETFTWTLGIEAHPPANLTWFGPDGIVRSNGEKLETRRGLDHVSLLIGNVQVSDSGRYRLAVSNSARIEWRTIHLVVLAEPESRWLRSADREASDFYKPGQHFTFVCQSRGIYGNVTVGFLRCQSDANCAAPVHPVAIYRSLRGNLTRVSTNRTTNDETVRMNVTNELSVLQLTLGGTTRSSGRYTCQACNPYGCSSVLTSQAQIIVSEFSGGFELWKNRNAVVEGDDVQLRCGVTRYNFVDRLRWSWHSADPRRDPSPTGLPPGVQLSQESSDVSHVEVLTLSSVATSANGTYTCRATSVDGNVAQKVISLAVQTAVQPEIWAISDPEQAMEPGNSTKLVCQFDGKPVPSIHWEKDGQPISGGYVTGSNQFVYEINFAKPEHSGIYKCVCKNKMGGSEQSFRVHVSSSLPLGILAAIVTVIFIAVALLIVLVIKVRNDQKRKALFRTEQMRNFDKGNPDSINPDLPVDEQAELLPYDRKWEFPRNRLNLGKQLGAGAFGRVLKAEASGIVENEPVTTVAVKMVRSQGNELALKALMSELKIMIHMGSHLNVVNLLGACTQNVTRGELLVIVEYCRFGNIQNFLIRNRTSFIDQINPLTGKLLPDSSQSHGGRRPSHGPDGADVRWDNEPTTPTTPTTPTSPVLTGGSALSDEPDGGNSVTVSGSSAHWRTNYRGDYRDQPTRSICTHDLLCWAFQIARGMAYLAKKKILHGDLAARNILLADDNVVKVADFGLAREVYRSGNYKKKGQGPLPVKWMAVESIMDRVFSTQSDVWAFGIVLWELFSLGKTPYPGLEPDEQFFQRLQEGYRMSKPRYATDDVYRMMTQCWQLEPSQRPDFNRLEDSMAAHLDESVRRHYLQLDQPHQQVNNQLTDNYLPMIKSPDYVNAGRQQPGPYVNVSCPLKLERLSSNTSDYLSMSDQGSAKRPTSSSFPEADYLLMTPSPTSDSVTDFPFPAVAQRLPPVTDQVGPVLTPDEQTAVDGGLTAFSNPNYRLDHTGLDVNDCVVVV